MAAAPEAVPVRGHQYPREDEVSQGPEILPDERQRLLHRLPRGLWRNLSVVSHPAWGEGKSLSKSE